MTHTTPLTHPAPKASMIQDYFALISARMKAEADLLLEFYRKHPGKLGEAREIILHGFFATYLPKLLSVGSGFTMSSDQNISTEQDLIIFDALHSPVLFPTNRSAIYAHSAVRCLIEVKSSLGKGEIVESVRKAAAVKQSWRDAPTVPLAPHAPKMEPLMCIFGFSGPELGTIRENLVQVQQDVPDEDRVDLVCLLNTGIIMSGTYFNTATFGQSGSVHARAVEETKREEIAGRYPDRTKCYNVGANALFLFYYWLTSYVMRMPPLFPDLIKYAPEGMTWGVEC